MGPHTMGTTTLPSFCETACADQKMNQNKFSLQGYFFSISGDSFLIALCKVLIAKNYLIRGRPKDMTMTRSTVTISIRQR